VSVDRPEESITIGNEFSEVRVRRLRTRNGSRLIIESPRTGASISLCPLQVEALTRQNTTTFAAMIALPFGPLVADDDEIRGR
jgi:hypothetical protein